MAADLTLRIITPSAIVLDTTVSAVRVPAVDGSMGVLSRHAAMITALDVGLLSYTAGGEERTIFVSGGFAEVRENTVRVVSEAGERPADIDEARAKEAERRARERLDEARAARGKSDIDIVRAEAALRRALLRQKVRGSGRG
ncbi:MAG: F0F1 ATP synthase subunit epsilon [Planctomycetota bacterium]